MECPECHQEMEKIRSVSIGKDNLQTEVIVYEQCLIKDCENEEINIVGVFDGEKEQELIEL